MAEKRICNCCGGKSLLACGLFCPDGCDPSIVWTLAYTVTVTVIDDGSNTCSWCPTVPPCGYVATCSTQFTVSEYPYCLGHNEINRSCSYVPSGTPQIVGPTPYWERGSNIVQITDITGQSEINLAKTSGDIKCPPGDYADSDTYYWNDSGCTFSVKITGVSIS